MRQTRPATPLTPTLSPEGRGGARPLDGATRGGFAPTAQISPPLPLRERVGVRGFSLAADRKGAR